MRIVDTKTIWFERRTGGPFPWYEKEYAEAKCQADAVDDAIADLEDDY